MSNITSADIMHIFNDDYTCFFARGHVDFDRIKTLVAEEVGDLGYITDYNPPRYTYFRIVPDSTGEHDQLYIETAGPARGAFKVTAITRQI